MEPDGVQCPATPLGASNIVFMGVIVAPHLIQGDISKHTNKPRKHSAAAGVRRRASGRRSDLAGAALVAWQLAGFCVRIGNAWAARCREEALATVCSQKAQGLFRELNPGPLAPQARIIPLDQTADASENEKCSHLWGSNPGPSAYKADALPLS